MQGPRRLVAVLLAVLAGVIRRWGSAGKVHRPARCSSAPLSRFLFLQRCCFELREFRNGPGVPGGVSFLTKFRQFETVPFRNSAVFIPALGTGQGASTQPVP